jgi:hypothetical protein
MEPIVETYRDHQIEIVDEPYAIETLSMGTLSPNVGRKAVIKVDGDDVTDECDSGDKPSPESMIVSARRYIDRKFFSKT